MKTIKLILILTLVLAMTGSTVFAQRQGLPPDDRRRAEGEFAPDPGQGNPPSEERREEIRKKIEAIRIWRLTEELKLDAGSSARLASLLGPLDQKRRELLREQIELMKELRSSLRAARPDEGKIKSLLENFEHNNHAMQELRDREIKGLKEVLTTEQQARYLLFQQEFQREMREMISGARSGDQGRGGMGPGNAPGMGNNQIRRGPAGPQENR